jgi:hypothetical protein
VCGRLRLLACRWPILARSPVDGCRPNDSLYTEAPRAASKSCGLTGLWRCEYKEVVCLEIRTDGRYWTSVRRDFGNLLRPNVIETWLLKDPYMSGGYYVEKSHPTVR